MLTGAQEGSGMADPWGGVWGWMDSGTQTPLKPLGLQKGSPWTRLR